MTEMHLVLDQVTKNFGNFTAVDHVSLQASEGDFVVLLGPSGCGKSTLLRMIAGLEKNDGGAISLGGQDLTRLEPAERDLAMVFQSYALYPHMSVRENIEYPLKIRKKSASEIDQEVKKVAAKLGLDALLHRRPKELSGGQRQRVALARAIVRRPRAFLMDEPLSNLDARLRVQMRAELKHLQRELSATTLYVTHDQAEAMTLATRVAVMDSGKLQQYGTPREIYNRPANLFVAGFLGSPSMNFMKGLREGEVLKAGELRVPVAGNLTRTQTKTRDVTLGFRPEDIEISESSRDGFTPAKVYVTEELGDENFLILDVNGTQVTARVDADTRVSEDSAVWFKPRAEKLHLFDTATGQNVLA